MIFDNHNVLIADVSFWQDDDTTLQKIDFAKMKSAGVAGVICRAGQNTWLDEDFADYWRAAKAAGLPRGSYWLYDSRSSPESQAMKWRAAVDGDLPELGLWVDLEERYGGLYGGETNWKRFIESVKSLFPGVDIGIYTSYGYWKGWVVTDVLYFASFPLWLAWYTSDPAYVYVPKAWTKCILWQFTSKGDGTKYGVESLNIDLSYWNGTLESFKNYFGVLPPGGTMIDYYEITANDGKNHTVRSTYNVRGSALGSITPTGTAKGGARDVDVYVYTADVVDAGIPGGFSARSGDKWRHVFELNGAPIDGWTAEVHLGVVQGITLKAVTLARNTVDVTLYADDGNVYEAKGVALTKVTQ